jgi:hypothetical protein
LALHVAAWQAVRTTPQRLYRAAVENAERRKIIYVADPPLAVFLAEILNGVDRGEPLPPAGEQHHPRRFLLAHDQGVPFVAMPGTGVIYQNRMKGRVVAWAPDDDLAREIARILSHVDYPMGTAGALVPGMGSLRDTPDPLPPSVLAPPDA